MNMLIKSSSGTSQVSVEAMLLERRRIYVTGEINEETAIEFRKQLDILNMANTDQPIDVYYYTSGGEIMAGMCMYDAIRASRAPVRMFCSKAYSMGAILFSSGRHGRYISENGELMLHEPYVESRVCGNASTIKSVSDGLLNTKRKMYQILADNTGKSVKEVERACRYDHYYNPEESIAFGLADDIRDMNEMEDNK